MSRGSEHSSEVLPFWNYSELRPSPRIRSLLDGVYQTSWGLIGPGLRLAFRSAHQQLRPQLSSARPDSSDRPERQRLLQNCEAAFVQVVKRRLQHSLLVLSAPPWGDQRLASDLLELHAQETIAESTRHREQMLLAQMSARAEIRMGSRLSTLAWRLAAIQAGTPAEPEEVLMGPYWMATALSAALAKGPAHPEDRRLLLRCMEQEVYGALPGIVGAVDDYLAGHHILPRIERFLAPHGSGEFSGTNPGIDPKAATSDTGAGLALGSPGIHRMPEITATPVEIDARPTTPRENTETTEEALAWDGPATRALRELSSREEAAELPLEAAGAVAANEGIDGQAIAKIWEFLGQRHSHQDSTRTESVTPTASSREVLGALHNLQQRSNRHFAYNSRADGPRDRDLRRALLNELRELTRASAPGLADADANVIALVGRLFGELLSQWTPTSRVHGLLARLEVPVCKAALLDKSFFMDTSQCARAFLDAVATACEDWIEDEEADRPVIERIEGAVDQLCNAYETDVASFEVAKVELERHLAALRKRSEISIRRQVEALKGREKLELARLAASEIILAITAQAKLPRLVELFLKNAWTDSVALAVLRHGIDSDATRERAVAACTLARHFGTAESTSANEVLMHGIEAVIREGLGAVGFHADAVHGAWRELLELGKSARLDDGVPAPHLSELAHSVTRLGGGKSSDAAGDTRPSGWAGIELRSRSKSGTEEPRVGQWLQIRTYPKGSVRRLLAWRSQVTGKILLADRRGTRVEEWDLAELLKSITAEEAVLRNEVPEAKVGQALRRGLGHSDQG
jgi:hypothetical protein